ncbi:metallophosphoesterase family protein [Parvularcula maris]|uniref:Serine/threonine protein phosphatase n=1 Tax=Parvularcula maris TaxID=2965077 RepID=A0A9X2L7A5_9PROT|nr:metallophosphoesterase family protein [Parvularcula maris]MCQ8184303.1 serine/threonine protein phosphatase [Parvularcula maris]
MISSIPIIYAIGDVHGQLDTLRALADQIAAHHRFRHPDTPGLIIQLGDMIDRGPRSAEVLRFCKDGFPLPSLTLKGNHEALMLRALDEGTGGEAWQVWLGNGGEETCASFGVDPVGGKPSDLEKAIGGELLTWLRDLPLTHKAGPYLFVHAGIRPGVPLPEQSDHDLLWIRERFLGSDADHGMTVVHGHTPTDEPVQRANRIGVDTGAGWGRKLTAVKLASDEVPEFFAVPVVGRFA